MNLHELSDQIEAAIVADESGWGEEIIYTKRIDGSAINPNPRALCQEGEYRKKRDEFDTVEDEATFMSVTLAVAPQQGDTIEYSGKIWTVERYDGNGIYDIYTKSGKRHSGARSARKRA